MNQFEAARARAEKKLNRMLAAQSADMGTAFAKPESHRPVIHLPKPSKTSGRHNEIDVSIYVSGVEFRASFSANVAGTLMASQISDEYLTALVRELLSTKFSRTKIL